jgi:hypothetical protein
VCACVGVVEGGRGGAIDSRGGGGCMTMTLSLYNNRWRGGGGEQRFMFSVLIGLIAALAGEGRRRGNCRNNTYARTGAGPGPVVHLPGLVKT